MAVLQDMVTQVMLELEAEQNEDVEEGSDSSEDDTMQFVTAHTSMIAMSPNIASSESDTGTMIEHGENSIFEDMGTLVITEDGEDEDGTMKRESCCCVHCRPCACYMLRSLHHCRLY